MEYVQDSSVEQEGDINIEIHTPELMSQEKPKKKKAYNQE